ncbi:hypothetical protein [Campylobacter helveticus]|uniref:hypothetical protein n=1 Tax=Campylobacter helveticus TaxID=28898 RepID=UPI001111AE08|nr:hypothetical protein [Campylobacter helveticus]TNB56690.1 hypothetical protein FDW44_07980 [Campylobacter helveticus]
MIKDIFQRIYNGQDFAGDKLNAFDNFIIENYICKANKELFEIILPDLKSHLKGINLKEVKGAIETTLKALQDKFLLIQEKINVNFDNKLKLLKEELQPFLKVEKAEGARNVEYCSLESKIKDIREYLQDCLNFPLPKNCQEVINDEFVIFNEPMSEIFATKIKNALKDIDYEVSLLKDKQSSKTENEEQFILVYAKDKIALKIGLEYLGYTYDETKQLDYLNAELKDKFLRVQEMIESKEFNHKDSNFLKPEDNIQRLNRLNR